MIKKAPFSLFLIIAGIFAFFPTFFNDFQRGWDDFWMLLENPFVLNSSWDQIIYHFTHFYRNQYAPLNTLFYIIIYKVFGFNPFAFHTVCLLIHIVNALLVYQIIRDVVHNIKPGYKLFRVNIYAFFVALVFVIHPLQVESVAWISASKVILYSFFTLVAIWSYIKYIHTLKWGWLLLVALSFALSFASKEQAIILPLVLLTFDYIYGRLGRKIFQIQTLFQKVVLEKIPFFMLALLFWYFSVENNLGSLSMEHTYPLYQRILMGIHSLSEYIFRTLAPVKLYYFYFFPIKIGEKLPLLYWGYLVLIVIIAFFVWSNYKKNNKLVVFGFIFFLTNILLVLHIVPMPRRIITADRYMYMGVIGLAIIGVWLVQYALIKFEKYKKTITTLITLYIAFFGIHTFSRTMDWKNSKTMKKNVKELIEKRKASQLPVINNPFEDE